MRRKTFHMKICFTPAIARIKKVWPKCASNVKEIMKAMKEFARRLEAVKYLNGSSTKLHFG